MNFGDSSHKTVEMRDYFWSSRAKMAPLSWNRVKNHKQTANRPQRDRKETAKRQQKDCKETTK